MQQNMTAAQADLWHQIQAFEIDEPGVDLAFSSRLARENAWSMPFADRVVEEYRRFVLLAMIAGHPVTPSDQIDQAWHLHLTYTVSYWERLCNGVLPRPLHHNPTRGGRSEDRKFDDWYGRTIASYTRIFGSPPRADIWPTASIRFGDDLKFQRVNTARYWVIRKAAVKRRSVMTMTIGAAAAMLVGCTPLLLQTGQGVSKRFMVISVVMISVLVIAIIIRVARRTGGSRGGSDSSGCAGWFGGCAASHSGDGGSDGGGGGCGGGGCGGGGD